MKKAQWIVWKGWIGNHDRRIDDAKCSNCGFAHPTVFLTLDKLGKYCPSCGRKMTVKEI